MAFFEDLQAILGPASQGTTGLAVGWLAMGHEYPRGHLDLELLSALASLDTIHAASKMHRCDLCGPEKPAHAQSGEYVVQGEGVTYAAPVMIRHYMREHGYSPPRVFASAVLAQRERRFVREGLEPVRQRPGMYIGDTGAYGLAQVLFELVSNSVDEHLSGAATRLEISVDEQGYVTVEDDGRGMALELIEPSFTTLHFGPTRDGHHPHVHLRPGLAGVGLGPVSALSSRLEAESRLEGVAHRAVFSQGRVVEPLRTHGETSKRGMLIRYLPDAEIFEAGTTLDLSAVEHRLGNFARLCPTLDLRLQGRSLQQKEGLAGWVRELAPDLLKETSYFTTGTVNDVEVEVALGWRPHGSGPRIRSFVNYAETAQAGSHEKGLLDAITELQASRKKEVLSGLVGVVHVRMLHPRFRGPIRAQLEVEAARIAVRDVMTRALSEAPWWWDRIHEHIG